MKCAEELLQRIDELKAENKRLQVCHESELGVCQQHCEVVAELQAIVGKLPKYTDTGQPFVPGVDDCWVTTENGKVVWNIDRAEEFRWDGEWECILTSAIDVFYSTTEAAEAANVKTV